MLSFILIDVFDKKELKKDYCIPTTIKNSPGLSNKTILDRKKSISAFLQLFDVKLFATSPKERKTERKRQRERDRENR
jgi:hypothetical protein